MQADQLRVPVGPGAMHVERFGHGGTAVILLHGFATSSFLWRNVAPAMAVAISQKAELPSNFPS